MNTTTESPRPSAHLSTVQELLGKLDEMKGKGLKARERLDFLLEAGPELVDDFDFRDAFDMELRAHSKRLAQLNELEATMKATRALWSSSPLQENVKEASAGLFSHLDTFLQDALKRERKTEMEVLAQLWQWAPDIRYLYPWLTAWTGPIYRPDNDGYLSRASSYPAAPKEPEPEPLSKEVQELLKAKTAIEKEIADDKPIGGRGWSGPSKNELKEFEKAHQTELERLRKFPVSRAPENEEGSRVVATVSSSNVKESELEPEEGPDHIRRDAWTQALRENTLQDWTFRDELEGSTTVLLWKAGKAEARLELVEKPGDMVNVWLRLLEDDGRFRSHVDTLNPEAVKELHLAPGEFVKKALDG